MDKQPVEPQWFNIADRFGFREELEWLGQLHSEVEVIADFGCWHGEEPFGLLWALDASQVVVVEIKANHLSNARGNLTRLHKYAPTSLAGRTVQLTAADMATTPIASEHVDLAYCEEVLYNTWPDEQRLRSAIKEMARIVKPGGWVIVIDTKIGAKFETAPDLFGELVPIRRTSPPIDISRFFDEAGLAKASLNNAPPDSYTYMKPRR